MKVIIIGAGPAGLSCAHELCKRNINAEVFEAGNHVGGMARSFDLWGQRVDLGPHRFFSKEKEVNRFFNELLGKEQTAVDRLTRIYYNGRFFNYPLRFGNVLANLPFRTICQILIDYIRRRLKPIKNPKTFEDWVTNRFGQKLFTIFFRSYSEKLWGIPCSQIDAEWASQRIQGLSLWEAVKNALFTPKKNKHKTLADRFFYPKNGMGTLYERCSDQIERMGGRVNLEEPVARILVNDKGHAIGIELRNGKIVYGDYVVSSMPITSLVRGFKDAPASVLQACSKLRFRNTILVYLEINATDIFKDNWIYIHSDDVLHGRITNFRNWCPSLYRDKATTILCMEFWAFDTDSNWMAEDDDLGRLAEKELRKLNLVNDDTGILRSHVVRVPKCYPVYDAGYRKHLEVVENYLDEIGNLIPIGRYGSFKYNNQDHSILMGLAAARKISGENAVNLWTMNTDTEYQENAKVDEVA